MSKIRQRDVVQWFQDATVVQVKDLLDQLEEKLGLGMMVMVGDRDLMPHPMVLGASNFATGAVEEPQLHYNHWGVKKIAVIKAMRSALGIGLREAKNLVETPEGKLRGILRHPTLTSDQWFKAERIDTQLLYRLVTDAGGEMEWR